MTGQHQNSGSELARLVEQDAYLTAMTPDQVAGEMQARANIQFTVDVVRPQNDIFSAMLSRLNSTPPYNIVYQSSGCGKDCEHGSADARWAFTQLVSEEDPRADSHNVITTVRTDPIGFDKLTDENLRDASELQIAAWYLDTGQKRYFPNFTVPHTLLGVNGAGLREKLAFWRHPDRELLARKVGEMMLEQTGGLSIHMYAQPIRSDSERQNDLRREELARCRVQRPLSPDEVLSRSHPEKLPYWLRPEAISGLQSRIPDISNPTSGDIAEFLWAKCCKPGIGEEFTMLAAVNKELERSVLPPSGKHINDYGLLVSNRQRDIV